MKIIDCKQGSTEWFRARAGVVTASEVDALVTPEGAIRKGDGVRTYLYQKVAEKLYGFLASEGGAGWAADQGKLLEEIALPWFAFEYDVKVDRAGFCVGEDPRTGCSPDALIGDDCGLEIKSPQPTHHVRYLLEGVVPKAYVPQVQMSMYVTGRPRWMFVSYSRDLPKLVLTVERDPAFQAALGKALAAFLADYDAALAKVRALMPAEATGARASA